MALASSRAPGGSGRRERRAAAALAAASGLAAAIGLLAFGAPPLAAPPGAPPAAPAPETAPVAEVKAAFVLNFIRFTTWPDRAFTDRQAPIVVGLMGRGEFSEAITKALRGRIVQGRSLLVRRLFDDAALLPPPHVIVFDGGAAARLSATLVTLGDAPVATVGDVPGFCARGGIFNLFLEADHVRFEVNTDAAEERGLQLSSSLLRLARRGPTEPGAKGR